MCVLYVVCGVCVCTHLCMRVRARICACVYVCLLLHIPVFCSFANNISMMAFSSSSSCIASLKRGRPCTIAMDTAKVKRSRVSIIFLDRIFSFFLLKTKCNQQHCMGFYVCGCPGRLCDCVVSLQMTVVSVTLM